MKLLFLIDEIYGPRGASYHLGWQMARTLSGLGCEVTVMENAYNPQEAYFSGKKAGIPVAPFLDATERELYQYVQDCREKGQPLPRMLLGALARPRMLLTAIRLLVFKRSPLEGTFRRKLEALCDRESFDAVVSVSAPHYSAMALAKSRISCIKAAYMLDPYSSETFKAVYSKRREAWLFNHLDIAFVTEQMKKEGLYPAGAKAKVISLPFPGLAKQSVPPGGNVIRLDSAYTNCVFVGGLTLGNREPTSLLELFAGMPENYRLVLIGPGYDLFPKEYRDHYTALLGDRLRVYPPVNQQTALCVQQQADVLVNIGNQDITQLPSKLYGYMSAGRPILNLYQKEGCPSLWALERYPMAIHIESADAKKPDTHRRLENFIAEHRGKRLDYEAVESLYGECTPEWVAKAMLAAFVTKAQDGRNTA